MKYYKIIKDDAFIGIASSNDFVRNQQKHQYLENVDESLAQFLSHDGILYRTTWMQPLPQKVYIYTEANVEEISEQLYNELAAAIMRKQRLIRILQLLIHQLQKLNRMMHYYSNMYVMLKLKN